MVSRECLICKTKTYSSDTLTEEWICLKCNSKIPKSQEEEVCKNKK